MSDIEKDDTTFQYRLEMKPGTTANDQRTVDANSVYIDNEWVVFFRRRLIFTVYATEEYWRVSRDLVVSMETVKRVAS